MASLKMAQVRGRKSLEHSYALIRIVRIACESRYSVLPKEDLVRGIWLYSKTKQSKVKYRKCWHMTSRASNAAAVAFLNMLNMLTKK
jgi:hypothetical protein